MEINERTIKNAISLSDYFIEHAKAALGVMKVNGNTVEELDLLKVIYRKYRKNYDDTGLLSTPISYREIQQAVKSRFDSNKIKTILTVLEERGFVRIFLDEMSFSKPKYNLLVNPYLIKSSPFSPIPQKALGQ